MKKRERKRGGKGYEKAIALGFDGNSWSDPFNRVLTDHQRIG
jgi:hypothetical protein